MASLGRLEDGFDYGHILDGVFEGDGDFGVFEDGSGEGVALKRVLVAGGEGFCGDAGAENVLAIVDEDAGRTVGWGVEGDFDFDAACGAEEMHALVGDELGAAGEDGVAVAEVEHGGG